MLHQSIDVAEATSADCPIREELTLLAAGLDTRFLLVGTKLADAVSMIDRIISGLDGVAEALDERTAGAAVMALISVADTLTALPADQALRSERMAVVADIAAGLHTQVLEMHRTLRVLGIYGMNIKIASSGEDQFLGFVEGMNGRLASGEQQLEGVLAKLKTLKAGLADVGQADRLLAAESVKVLPALPRQLTADAVGLNAHLQGVSNLARQVSVIARSVQSKVAVLLGALQVGDSTRQRLEHVVSAMHIIEARFDGKPASAHINCLLAAQLDAAASDFGCETTALISALNGLAPDVEGLLDIITEQTDGGGRAFMMRLEENVSGVDRVVVQLQSARDQAEGMTALIGTTVCEVTTRVNNLGRVRRDVQNIATNTRLLCRREDSIGRAVSVVAAQVDAYARALGDTTASVAATVDCLREVEISSSASNDAEPIGEALKHALDVIRRACERIEGVALEGGDDARRFLDILHQTADTLSTELDLTGTIQRISLTLRDRSTAASNAAIEDNEALPTLLRELARLYTMSKERDVHDRFLLPGMAIASATSSNLDENDVLF